MERANELVDFVKKTVIRIVSGFLFFVRASSPKVLVRVGGRGGLSSILSLATALNGFFLFSVVASPVKMD